MAVSRRGFIVSTAAFAALERLPIFAAGKRDLSNPDLKLGVISDVHIRNAGDEKTVADVLRWYRNNLVDAVVNTTTATACIMAMRIRTYITHRYICRG